MAPAMTGPQTTAAETAKITAMITQDHQSLSADCVTVPLAFLRASTRRTFATATLLGMTCEKKWVCRRLACIPERGTSACAKLAASRLDGGRRGRVGVGAIVVFICLDAWKQSGVVKTLMYYSAEDEGICSACKRHHGATVTGR